MRPVVVLASLAVACGSESSPRREPPVAVADATVRALDAAAANANPIDAADAKPWRFAVLSDLHLPNPRARDVDQVVAALIELHVRLVVVTGDHTNGNPGDAPRTLDADGWNDVRRALQPLRDAHIPVLPVAGNHDVSTRSQHDHYALAFEDLADWAAPLPVTPPPADARGNGRAPFSYSVDVDGVHLALTHLVSTTVDADVEHWLTTDLAAAAGATHRIVFGHVPMSSVIYHRNERYIAQLGGILERGHATMHVAGHEHIVWDEDVPLPGGTLIREVLIGCSSGFYQYAPQPPRKLAARCAPLADPTRKEPMRCYMPHGGGAFEIARGRKNRHVQHARTVFTLFTVNGASIEAAPMTIDAKGNAIPFYLDDAH